MNKVCGLSDFEDKMDFVFVKKMSPSKRQTQLRALEYWKNSKWKFTIGNRVKRYLVNVLELFYTENRVLIKW